MKQFVLILFWFRIGTKLGNSSCDINTIRNHSEKEANPGARTRGHTVYEARTLMIIEVCKNSVENNETVVVLTAFFLLLSSVSLVVKWTYPRNAYQMGARL